MRPFHLVALVALEALLLTAIAWIQSPHGAALALMDSKPQPLRARLGTLAFGAVWLGFVYAIILGAMLGAGGEVLAAFRHPLTTLRQDTLFWPLTLTAHLRRRRRGARLDALALRGRLLPEHARIQRGGAVAHAVPRRHSVLRATGVRRVCGLAPWLERLNKRRAGSARARRGGYASKLAPFIAPALAAGLFGVMGWLLEAGVSGWAVGYCSAKLAERELPRLPASDRAARRAPKKLPESTPRRPLLLRDHQVREVGDGRALDPQRHVDRWRRRPT